MQTYTVTQKRALLYNRTQLRPPGFTATQTQASAGTSQNHADSVMKRDSEPR